MPVPVLDTRTLNRTLLARQLLLARVTTPPIEAIDHLVGLQAQVPTSPYIALWSRLEAYDPAVVAEEVLAGRLVRMALMRSTIHLVTVEDALSLRAVMQPVLDAELYRNRTWSVGLEGVDIGPVLDVGRALIEERPRPLRELRAAMAERFPDRDATTLAYTVRNLLPTYQVPPRGAWGRAAEPTLGALDHATGRPMGSDPSPDDAVLRYLAAFGPASVADVAAWSRLTGMRAVLERLRPGLHTFRDEAGRELFDVPDWLLAEADLPAPVRFLPDYDNALLSHDDRSRILPDAFRAITRERGGPSFLVDGFVAGFWRLRRPGARTGAKAGGTAGGTAAGKAGGNARAVIEVEPLARLSGADRAAVEAEAVALLGLLAPDGGDVRFVSPA
ncbi:MAG: winged helix DNA-binding domain-containing protein [Chloroflexota bacterium]